MNHKSLQSGLSLIELMIAVALGLIVTAAMISLFSSSKQTSRVTENMSRLQENARFASLFLARDVRMTDYRACTTDDKLANAISGSNNSGLNNSDTITLQWQPNSCGGAAVTTIYSLATGSGGNPALFRSIDGTNQELIEGIENMQILYGEDTDSDQSANYYVNSASISNMANVISVRITLTIRTLESGITSSGGRLSRDLSSTIVLRNRLP